MLYNHNTAVKKYGTYGPNPSSSISLVFITAVRIGNTLNRLKAQAAQTLNTIIRVISLLTIALRFWPFIRQCMGMLRKLL